MCVFGTQLRFLQADIDQDGLVSREEWRKLLSHPAVQLWIGSMDLDAEDAWRSSEIFSSGFRVLPKFPKGLLNKFIGSDR